MTITLTPSVFTKLGCIGDFEWMIDRPEFGRTLFVFNDNEEQFLAFHAGRSSGGTRGGGNAKIRPYQVGANPRAAGIPTGRNGCGYPRLDDNTRAHIDRAIEHVRGLLASGRFDEVRYSATETGELGVKIFSPSDDVKRYIVSQLREIVKQ
jgi:hypothetical protein